MKLAKHEIMFLSDAVRCSEYCSAYGKMYGKEQFNIMLEECGMLSDYSILNNGILFNPDSKCFEIYFGNRGKEGHPDKAALVFPK